MDYLGEIVSGPDPAGISNQRWIDLIREHPNLDPIPPREGINPFTKEKTLYRAPLDSARVVVGGEQVGAMSWAEDESNLINVFGKPQAVIPLAHDIAESLGGRFELSRSG